MWRRTRDPRVQGPNERMVAADARRLRAWRTWLRKGVVKGPSPVAGAWQLLLTMENFAPAAQKAVVERRTSDGSWREIFGLFAIEFQAAAAQPRARRRHRVSLPIPWNGAPGDFPQMRLAVRGFGRLRFRDLV